jgi:hypothetical protein
LNDPHYDFKLATGLQCRAANPNPEGHQAHRNGALDNSANNKFNPDQRKTVYYGDMTWEEMTFPFFSIVVDKGVDAESILKLPSGRANGA